MRWTTFESMESLAFRRNTASNRARLHATVSDLYCGMNMAVMPFDVMSVYTYWLPLSSYELSA